MTKEEYDGKVKSSRRSREDSPQPLRIGKNLILASVSKQKESGFEKRVPNLAAGVAIQKIR